MSRFRFCLGIAAVVAAGCAAPPPAPPHIDHEEAIGDPVFEPMLVVPMPSLEATKDTGRSVEALQARRTPIGDVLLTLFKDSDINLLVDPDVQALECTFDIKRSTVEESFEALLRSLDLGYEWDGSYLRVRRHVRRTVHVDLMESTATGAAGAGQGSGSNGSSGSGGGNGAAGENNDFWEQLQGSLQTVLGEDATFVVNRAASTVHVEARPSGIERLTELVDTTTRRANKQVSLEARVLEVRLENEYSLGVNWSLLPGFFNSNLTGTGGGNSVVRQTAASGGTALTFGLLDSGDWSVFVDALQKQGQVRVLSSPRVATMNNRTASISVTDQIPYITRDVIDDQGVARTEFGVEFVESGVTLNVKPMIGEDGMLSVAITPQVREQTGTIATPDGLVVVPIISQREATTVVRCGDGQAIALGGLRSTRKGETRQGVPLLMDVPWLGQLFSSTVQNRTEVELMIVLVPRVLDDSWIDEEIRRGAHRLVQLRHGFQFNPIQLEGYRPEDWTGGSLQGRAQVALAPTTRIPTSTPRALPADRGVTVTRRGLAAHLLATAQAALDDGRPRVALEAIEKAISLEPQRVDAQIAAAVLRQRDGDVARARLLLDRALALAPDDVVALSARGSLELGDGAAEAGVRYLQRAHELGGTAMTAANLGAALIAVGDVGAARDLMLTVPTTGAPPELHANLAFAELGTGHLVEAREQLQRALAGGADSRNPRLVALQRSIQAAERKAAAAAAEAAKATGSAPDDTGAKGG